ncbi:MAG: NAD(P)-binding domain-containing protein, partial [Aurantimicrobium sp.]|uniref:NAD(P)-binding domain-containing protein n=1 Tax=Aurantimicrobium sp. TaxID=1930784 RepID=UPI00321FE074
MNQQRDGRLGIGIIGAGKVGPILGAALAGAGHALVGISAISEESKERAQAILPDVPVLEVPRIVELSELVLIAVPDEELPDLVNGLAGVWQPGQIVLHTSAAYGVEVLHPAVLAGVIPLALHPAMAFTGTSMDIARLADCYIAVTAPAPVLPIGQALAVEMGGEPVVISEAQRP